MDILVTLWLFHATNTSLRDCHGFDRFYGFDLPLERSGLPYVKPLFSCKRGSSFLWCPWNWCPIFHQGYLKGRTQFEFTFFPTILAVV